MPTATISEVGFPAQIAQSGTFTSSDIRNPNCVGVKVVLNVTANAGGLGSLVLKVQGKDKASGTYWDILTSSALTAVATTVFTIAPSIVTSAGVAVRDALPATWRITVSGNGNPVSFTIGASMIP